MQEWSACATCYGEDEARYSIYYFEIPDEMYDDLMSLVEKKIPIDESKYWGELRRLANEAFDIEELIEYEEREPERSDYEDSEEYEADLEEYNDGKRSFYSNWNIESIEIDDPGDMPRLVDYFRGKKLTAEWLDDEFCVDLDEEGDDFEGGTFEEELSQGENLENHCYVTVTVDRNGCIEDVEAYAEGLEREGITHSGWNECFPDYFVVEEFLKEIVGEEDCD